MKTLKENTLLLFLLSVCMVLLKDTVPKTILLTCGFYWYLRLKDKSFLIVLLLFSLFLIPVNHTEMTSGKAVTVKSSYAVLQKGRSKILVYTDEPLYFDAVYEIRGTPKEITSSPGFYSFNFEKWCRHQNIEFYLDSEDIILEKESFSIRRLLQKRIGDDEILQRFLLNMKTDEEDQLGFFFDHGFSASAVCYAVNMLLRFILSKEKRKKLNDVLIFILFLIYGPETILLMSFLNRVLSFFRLTSREKSGLTLFLTVLCRPDAIYSAGFWIAAVYRLSFLFQQKGERFFLVSMIQTVFYHSVSPVMTLCFPVLRLFIGFGYLSCVLTMITGLRFFIYWIIPAGKVLRVFDLLTLKGSPLGFGLIFFVPAYILCKGNYRYMYRIVLLYAFSAFGLFHPLAEVTFINVGQGNAAYLSSPFGRTKILIDTGKESQRKNLTAYLDAKSVYSLSGLIISHGDEDHCGSEEYVLENYHPDILIDSHQMEYKIGEFMFLDLNDLVSEDENRSSVTSYFSVNDIRFLMMGDCDETAEMRMIERFGNLTCDVLLGSHHGSKTGNSSKFLDTVQPRLCVISCGSPKIYNHPSEEVIQRLLARHIPYEVTYTEGDVSFFFLAGKCLMITSSGTVCWVV